MHRHWYSRGTQVTRLPQLCTSSYWLPHAGIQSDAGMVCYVLSLQIWKALTCAGQYKMHGPSSSTRTLFADPVMSDTALLQGLSADAAVLPNSSTQAYEDPCRYAGFRQDNPSASGNAHKIFSLKT